MGGNEVVDSLATCCLLLDAGCWLPAAVLAAYCLLLAAACMLLAAAYCLLLAPDCM